MFDTVLPYYLKLGMSYDDFMFRSPYLTVLYREMNEQRKEERNQEMWLLGIYIQDAFRSVMDNFTYGLNRCRGARPKPYMKQPIAITEHEKEVEKQRKIAHTLKWFKEGQNKK